MAYLGQSYRVADMVLDDDVEHSQPGDTDPGQTFNDDAPTSNREVAMTLAAAGMAVHPCRPDKKPFTQWRDTSTSDPREVERLWQQFPDALVGIDCGKSGLVVIDLDRHGQVDGIEEFWQLVGDPGKFGAAIVVTANDGVHLFFVAPPGETFGNNAGAFKGRGIDVRGTGGYIIAAGSSLSDGRRWVQESGPDIATAYAAGTLPELPKVIVDLIRAPKEKRDDAEQARASHAGPTPRTNDGTRERSWALAKLTAREKELAQTGEGGRNQALNDAAFSLGRVVARGWVSEAEARATLEGACQANGLWRSDGAAQCRKTIDSGLSAGRAQPHPDLPESESAPHDEEISRIGNKIAEGLKRRAAANEEQADAQAESTAQAGGNRESIDPLAGFIFDGDAPLEPPRMLVKTLIPFDGIGFVGGQSGAGKTFAVIDLAVSLASGEPFFGHKVVERVGVAIFAAEGASTIASRVTVARNHKAGGEILPIVWLGQVPDLVKPLEARGMIARLQAVDARFRETHGVRLGAIILDTLAATFAIEDENDNSKAAVVIRAMKVFSDALGVVVLPVHHFGKAAETGLRGASAWRAGCDVVLSVLADRDQTTGQCSNRRIALTKSRVGEEGWVAPFDLRFVKLGEDEDGDDFGACYVEPGKTDDAIITVKEKGPPRYAKVYLDAFGIVIGDKGRKVRPFGSEGSEVVAVDREDIRGEYYRLWPADGDDEKARVAAQGKAFKRGEVWAADHRLISSYEVGKQHMVWLLKDAGQ